MKTKLLALLLCIFALSSSAQNVNIPDANFKAALVANTNINTNGDTEIQVSEASSFTGGIGVGNMNISDLTGIEAFTEIIVLGAFQNPITSIDVSQNTKLEQLLLEQTQLSGTLDLSMMPNLRDFKGHTTGLTAINMANGNNSNVTRFNVVSSSVVCVQIDAGFVPNNNWDIPPFGSYSEACSQFPAACSVNIPDANFKAALVGNTAINTNGNTEIECSEASAFNNTINVSNMGITDMTGLEAFTNLRVLNCLGNSLTSLDISSNTNLEILIARNNQLSIIDVSANTNLQSLNLSINQFTSLDLSANTALIELFIDDNQFTVLDVSANTNLNLLRTQNNQLSSIDVSSNVNLGTLNVSGNQLTTLDVSANPNLIVLYLDDNQISTLDTSASVGLIDLFARQNQLTSLDVAANPALIRLLIENNQLTSLNVANGNNSDILNFNVTGNAGLSCIQIDAGYTPTPLWFKDTAASYSDNCTPVCTVNIPDANFKAALVADTLINTNGNNEIECTEAAAYNDLVNVSSNNITDLTGIEAFTSMTQLNCNDNQLTSLDVSGLPQLVAIICNNNDLTTLDVTANTNLFFLSFNGNNISTIDVSAMPDLQFLRFRDNQLSNIDVSNNPILRDFDGSLNNLSGLDFTNNPDIKTISAFSNNLPTVNFSSAPDLDFLFVQNNPITALDVTAAPGLLAIALTNTQLTTIDVSNNPLLTEFTGNDGIFTDLDFSNNPAMSILSAANNDLMSLNIANGNNAGLGNNFSVINNPNLTCIQIDAGFTPPSGWSKDAGASYSDNCNADTAAPVANCQNVTTSLDVNGNLTINAVDIDNGSTDNIGIVSFSLDQTVFDCSHVGANTVMLTVTDAAGNTDTCTATLTIIDDIAPQIVQPGDVVDINDTGNCSAFVTIPTFNAIENCTTTFTTDAPANLNFPVGTTLVTLTATDPSGNTDTTTFNVTVEDIEVPTITCSAAITALVNEGELYTLLDYVSTGDVMGSDNCSVSITQTPASGTQLPVGVHTISFEATDPSGNSVTCSFEITVEETLSLENIDLQNTVRMYPNPVSDIVTISSEILISEVMLFDVTGAKVFTGNQTTFNVSGLSSGVYFVQLVSENGQTTVKKLIKK